MKTIAFSLLGCMISISGIAQTINSPVSETSSKTISVKLFLEGAFDVGTGTMNTALNIGAVIPLAQPYNVAPWNYAGTESVVAIPAGVVDWILIELRDAATPADAIHGYNLRGWPRALFLKSDGSVTDLDGTSLPGIGNPTVTNNLFVVIRHRNHLAVMSATGAILSSGVYSYDFTTGLAKAYGGGTGYKMAGSKAAMVAGDIDHDESVFVSDYNGWAFGFGSSAGYYYPDLNMDGSVFVSDYNIWASNFGTTSSGSFGPGDIKVIFSKLETAIASFIVKSGFNVELLDLVYNRNIPSDSVDYAIDEIIDNAAFIGDSSGIIKAFRLDSVMTTDIDTLAAVKNHYKSYLDSVINKPDMIIVTIVWKINDSDTLITLGVVRQNGDIVYEPILDVCYLEPVNTPVNYRIELKTDTTYTNHQIFKWKNVYGVIMVDIRLDLKATSADGCQASFNYVVIGTEAAWPLDVKLGTPTITQYCQFKANCMCRTEPDIHDRMECATGSTSYEIAPRFGISVNEYCKQCTPEYMKVYKGTISGSICADGT